MILRKEIEQLPVEKAKEKAVTDMLAGSGCTKTVL